jgi:hypothetical protein
LFPPRRAAAREKRADILRGPMSPFDRPDVRVFHRSFTSRAPGPLGCLAALILLPVVVLFGLLVGGVATIARLFTFGGRRRGAAAFRPATPEAAAREEALRRLVRAMALDDTFTADDARQAGTLVAGGATVDDLLADGVERGLIEVRGGRLAVTRRGREEVERLGG